MPKRRANSDAPPPPAGDDDDWGRRRNGRRHTITPWDRMARRRIAPTPVFLRADHILNRTATVGTTWWIPGPGKWLT